MASAGLVVRRW